MALKPRRSWPPRRRSARVRSIRWRARSRAMRRTHHITPGAVDALRALPGQGAEGRVGGEDVVIGSRRLFEERGIT